MFLIHGYYSQPYAVSTLGPLIDPEARYLVMAPRGPHPLPPHDSYWVQPGGGSAEEFAEIREALDALVDETCATRGFRREDTLVGGFSQGAGLALAVALASSDRPRVAGVMCLSGYMPETSGVDWDLAASRGVSVLVQHGTEDPMVPVDRGRWVAERLRAAGLPVTYEEYPMGHDISIESLIGMRTWVAKLSGT
jgi:phospholipase/carboxylesterase